MKRILFVILLVLGASPYLSAQRVLQQRLTTADATSLFAPGEDVVFGDERGDRNIPIVVENCLFTDNMAGNGGGLYSNGGIYMYGCHFTQNY